MRNLKKFKNKVLEHLPLWYHYKTCGYKLLYSKQRAVFWIFLFKSWRETGVSTISLFLFKGNVLDNAVRKDKEIRGIKIGTTDCKLSQYADDTCTTMILDGSELSFSKTLNLFDKFADISSLKVNYEKTEALWIGSCKSSSRVIPSNKPISGRRGKSMP